MTYRAEERANDAAIEYARRFLPYCLGDDEVGDVPRCPLHGPMDWYKGKWGEQIWVCTKCNKENE